MRKGSKVLSLVLFILLAATAAAMAADITLHAIFLPATWGTITKDVFAAEYEKMTGVKVEVDLVGRDAIHDKMATLFAAKDSSYDIFNIDYNWLPEFGRAGALVPLDLSAPEWKKSDFLPKALEIDGQYKGVQYGVPDTVHPHILWYRKDVFADPAIQRAFKARYNRVLRPPATMQEWKDFCVFIQNRQYKGAPLYGWAAQAAKGFGNVHTWLTFLYSFGGDAFDYSTMKPTLTTPQAIAATRFWAEMMKLTPPGINDYTYDEVTNAAASGKLATALQWSWGAWAVDDPKSSKVVGLFDFVPVPAGPGGSVAHLAAWNIVVSTYSEHKPESVKFIQWLESPENDVKQALLGGGDPVRRSSYDNPQLTRAKVEGFPNILRFRRYPVVLKTMETTKPRPVFPDEERWETVVSADLHAIQLGQSSVEDGLKKAQADVTTMMTELGYY